MARRRWLAMRSAVLVMAALVAVALVAILLGRPVRFGAEAWPPKGEVEVGPPTAKAVWADAFEGSKAWGGAGESTVWARRVFNLMREPGATLELGACPGEACYRFRLGEIIKRGAIPKAQQIFLTGSGFGWETRPRGTEPPGGPFAELRGRVAIRGGTGLTMMFDGRMWTTLALQKGARLDLATANADIRFEVLSTDVNSLRFLVELAKGTWVPLEQRREQSTPS